jgi:hypothetical protein
MLIAPNSHKMADPSTIASKTPGPFVFVGVDPQTSAARPDLSGLRLKLPNQLSIYVVDAEGFRRLIPNPTTYNNLFRGWDGVIVDIDVAEVSERVALIDGAVLMRGDQSAAFFILDRDESGVMVKRWITTPDMFDKYYFDWKKVVVVPQTVVDAVPTGRVWE